MTSAVLNSVGFINPSDALSNISNTIKSSLKLAKIVGLALFSCVENPQSSVEKSGKYLGLPRGA